MHSWTVPSARPVSVRPSGAVFAVPCTFANKQKTRRVFPRGGGVVSEQETNRSTIGNATEGQVGLDCVLHTSFFLGGGSVRVCGILPSFLLSHHRWSEECMVSRQYTRRREIHK